MSALSLTRTSLATFEWRSFATPITIVTILAVAIWLRFANLGYSDLQGDEVKALPLLSDGESFFDFLLRQRKGPVQWLITYAYGLFDPSFSNTLLMRVPFATASVAAVLVFYFLVKLHFGNRVAAIAALLMATNGIFVAFGRIIQYESVTMLFLLLSLLFFSVSLKIKIWNVYGLYLGTIFCGLAILSHFDGTSIVLPITYLLYLWYQQNKLPNALGKAAKIHLILSIFILFSIMFLFYIPYALSLTNYQTNYWQWRMTAPSENSFSVLIFYNCTITVVVYTIFSFFSLGSLHLNRQYILIYLWLIPPFLFLEGVMARPGLHIYTYLLPVFIFVALGYEVLAGKPQSRFATTRRVAVTVILLAGLLSSFLSSHLIFVDHTPEFPFNDKKLFGMTKEGGQPDTFLMGFPHRRDWPIIAKILEGLPDRETARYVTNEKSDVADFYLKDAMRPFSRREKFRPSTLYLIAIEDPKSWDQKMLGRPLDYWRSREDLTRVAVNDRAEIILLFPKE